jgi:hypothetical protein
LLLRDKKLSASVSFVRFHCRFARNQIKADVVFKNYKIGFAAFDKVKFDVKLHLR